jgi:hypothetical protein
VDKESTRLVWDTLNVINSDITIESLLGQGYQYSQIAFALKILKNEGFIESKDDILRITESGLKFLKTHYGYGKKKKKLWLAPIDKYRIYRYSIWDIYLPRTANHLRREGSVH